MTFKDFWLPLCPLYGDAEARAIARMVMERRFGLSLTDVACGAVERLDDGELAGIGNRLLRGEPVQYVLGEADFCGRTFTVGPGVLIPRPETEWLCRKAVELLPNCGDGSCLDIGTGSGCIACTLALEGFSEVVAWDVSDSAIAIARANAFTLGAKVAVVKQDALTPPQEFHRWDVIVSNPPYVCEQEREAMHENVLNHEPAEALFVPDDDPLLFYRAIARYAHRALKPGGTLLLEINPLYATALQTLLSASGFSSVEIVDDVFGKRRFAVAGILPS